MKPTDEQAAPVRKEIEALEHREAQAMLAADVATLGTLWADDLLVNSTSNLIAGKEILLEMVKNGLLKLRMYERRPVRVQVFGELVVTTGNEVSELVTRGEVFKVFVSYMNIWTKRAGNWQLLARHVGMIERARLQDLH
ncbi:MAG: nuclear transport factor 2 family protein [Candidatus Binatus sp.]|jgi:hypothetical protein